mmetsp:Transcript_14603/g.44141  ORF Transcript_14603/g.44141 Transcript_14603/m.44141 type:complete len:149 (-) Transcript_14603:377-823(-)
MPAPGRSLFYAATGALAGCATGLLGIGGGTVVTPMLAAAGGLLQPAVLGTALLAMLPPSAVALAGHARLGNVDWRLAAGLAAGAAGGSFVGSFGAVHAPPGAPRALGRFPDDIQSYQQTIHYREVRKTGSCSERCASITSLADTSKFF